MIVALPDDPDLLPPPILLRSDYVPRFLQFLCLLRKGFICFFKLNLVAVGELRKGTEHVLLFLLLCNIHGLHKHNATFILLDPTKRG